MQISSPTKLYCERRRARICKVSLDFDSHVGPIVFAWNYLFYFLLPIKPFNFFRCGLTFPPQFLQLSCYVKSSFLYSKYTLHRLLQHSSFPFHFAPPRIIILLQFRLNGRIFVLEKEKGRWILLFFGRPFFARFISLLDQSWSVNKNRNIV